LFGDSFISSREQIKPRMLWFEAPDIPSELCSLLTGEMGQHPAEIFLIHLSHSRRFVEKSDFRAEVRDATQGTTSNVVQRMSHFLAVAE
jgi:hypothetical protein